MENQQATHKIAADEEYGIICPYCFNLANGGDGSPFPHTKVHFRTETSFSNEREIEQILKIKEAEIDLIGNEVEKKKKRAEFNKHKKFIRRVDKKYEAFWARYDGNTTEPRERNGSLAPWELPVVEKGAGIVTLFADKEGFVTHGTDEFKNVTYRRVCPYCHNPLPLKYGKNPVKFISIIGITGSGKTVYISQLLKNMTECVAKAGLSAYFTTDHETNFIEKNKVARGIELPDSTPPGALSQPMFYDIVRMVDGKQRTDTIVLYDIAGENCRNANDMVRFSSFVQHSHGLILLVDPKQLGFLPGADEEDVDAPSTALNTLHSVLESEQGKRSAVPIAVCVSKSDQCAGILPSLAQEHVQVAERDTMTGLPTQKFDARTFNQLSAQLKEMMLNNPCASTVCQNLMDEYWNYNFFALSAVGCACEATEQGYYAPVSRPDPKRIEEPILWLFKQFGIISYNEKCLRPFPIEQKPRFTYKKPFLRKPYLEMEPKAYSKYEEETVQERPLVFRNGEWTAYTREDQQLEVK